MTTLPHGRDRRMPSAWAVVLLTAATVGVYFNSLTGVFLFDDSVHIVANERIRHLSSLGTVLSGKRPVVDLTLAVNYALGGLQVATYHAFNLAIHFVAALVLFGIVRRTLSHELFSYLSRKEAHGLALATALIWAIHPLQTQSVTYVIQRAESLMGLFYLLTLYCFIRGPSSSRAVAWFIVAVLCCALGMGSKAVMISAPLVVWLYDRLFIAKSWGETLRRRWGVYLALASTWSILWLCGIGQGVLNPLQKGAHVGFGYRGTTPLAYFLTQLGVLVEYGKLSIWPHPLCLDYNWPVTRALVAIIPQALLVGTAIAATIVGVIKRRAWGFPGTWFFLILAPTSSFIPIKDALFEHRMYLPLAAVIASLLIAGYRLTRSLSTRLKMTRSCQRFALASAMAVVVSTLGYGTVQRNRVYHSAESMWQDVVAKRPRNARAFENLGTVQVGLGKKSEAIESYRRAVGIDPDFASAHANLATALMEAGHMEQAVHHWKEVIRVEPEHTRAWINLGNALHALGRDRQSVLAFQSAVRITPRHTTSEALARAHFSLGSALGRQGDLNAAVAEYRKAIDLWPTYEKALFGLGSILARLGNEREAIKLFERTLEVNPNHVRARRARARLLTRLQGSTSN